MSKTRQELEAEIAALRSQLSELGDHLNRQAAISARSGEPGWLISTKNKGYSGNTAGVLFRNGFAFLPASLPGAAGKVALLVNDYGYTVEAADAAQADELMAPAPDEAEPKAMSVEDVLGLIPSVASVTQ